MKIRRKHRYIMFRLGEEEIEGMMLLCSLLLKLNGTIVEKTGARNEVWVVDIFKCFSYCGSIRLLITSNKVCPTLNAVMPFMTRTTRLMMDVLHRSCGLFPGFLPILLHIIRWLTPLPRQSLEKLFLVCLIYKCHLWMNWSKAWVWLLQMMTKTRISTSNLCTYVYCF